MNPNSLNDIIEIELDKIGKKTGLSTNCIINVVSDESLSITKSGELVDVFITPGDPPKLYITWIFIGRCFFLEKAKPLLFKDRLQRAVEKFPMMRRTLLNNIKSSTALILRKDYTRWLKTKLEVEDAILGDDCFEISYNVEVKEKLSGISFTGHSATKAELALIIDDAKRRISAIVERNEEVKHFRQMLIEMKKSNDLLKALRPEGKVEQVTIISGDKDQTKEIHSYDSSPVANPIGESPKVNRLDIDDVDGEPI